MKGEIELCKVEVMNEAEDTMFTYCMGKYCIEMEIMGGIGDTSDILLQSILESVKIRFERLSSLNRVYFSLIKLRSRMWDKK